MKKSILFLLTLILFSCASSVKNSANKPLFEILTEPNEIKMLQNDDKLKNKIIANDIQTCNFIVLNMGEKATSGYKIDVESVVETDKNIVITVKETSPESGSIVSQVFTNPYCIVKVNSKKEIIIK
jgi:hypothetical protein